MPEADGDQTDASVWFDQFPVALRHIKGNDQWCARHWAPCPLLGANGVGAATELMQVFVDEIATERTPEGLNAEMQRTGRLCCALGDDRMYKIWGHWPPTGTGGN